MLSTSFRTVITEVVDPNRVPLYLREADQIRPVPYPSSVQKKGCLPPATRQGPTPGPNLTSEGLKLPRTISD